LAVVLFDHDAAGFDVNADIHFLEGNLSCLEISLRQFAQKATGLGVEQNAKWHSIATCCFLFL
jgi:hypothetical protein